jgi:thiol-disulfide isomerase/thioredoxin
MNRTLHLVFSKPLKCCFFASNSGRMEAIATPKDYHDFLSSQRYTAVYYSTEECGVCQALMPRVEEVFRATDMPLKKASLHTFRALAGQQLILKSPTVVVYEGGREIYRDSGYLDFSKLQKNLSIIQSID